MSGRDDVAAMVDALNARVGDGDPFAVEWEDEGWGRLTVAKFNVMVDSADPMFRLSVLALLWGRFDSLANVFKDELDQAMTEVER